MNTHTRYPTADLSTAEKRPRKFDFTCECGNKWNTPGHIFWAAKMYCTECGEKVEAR
jgi:predicted SprT family Zn-dependent metalloprotease